MIAVTLYFLAAGTTPTFCEGLDKSSCTALSKAFRVRSELDACLRKSGEQLAQGDDALSGKYRVFIASCATERSKCVSTYFDFQVARATVPYLNETAESWRVRMNNSANWCDERFQIFGPRTIGSNGDKQS